MASTRRRIWEWTRNILLIALCLGAVAYLYSRSSVLSEGTTFRWSGSAALRFSGDITRSGYSRKELAEVRDVVDKYRDLLASLTINVTVQDDYARLTDASQVLYGMRAGLRDGAVLDLSVRRTTRARLVPALITDLDRALEPLAYRARWPKGSKGPRVVNTP